ncbi:flagellar hook-associated protein FlgK [Nitrosococcus oceani]|uniref:flagellar hook-associated protein FlgK n=1 Tax=Nitrosococcus oceani TaxID=1229 RepID=UPI0004E92B6A|nr:flagellar hook-associated protein FlgK [Nitrosococcus oceani]KFI21970.1 flagellar hook protein FlgK [Nitrosococcus oceani]
MASSDLLGIGASGLLAAQRALATTSHNIANVNTPGFSRQRTELAARLPEFTGQGFIGTGVDVTTVRRAYDSFLTEQARHSTSEYAQSKVFHDLAAQVDNLFADSDTGLSASSQRFFNATQELANDPSSSAARQVLLAEGGAFATRVHSLGDRLGELDEGINTRLRDTVAEVNTLSSSIAGLNQQIRDLRGQNNDQPPNDLLDQRDQLIQDLSQKAAVTVLPQDDGSLNVFIGKGQSLVTGNHSHSLTTLANPYEASRLEVGYAAKGGVASISDSIQGGELGALLSFRDEVLAPSRNALGQLAVGVAQSFNEQHRLGVDLQGELGGDFFAAIDSNTAVSLPRADNTGDGVIEIAINDASKLTDSDYRLDRHGAGFTLTRLSDNQAFSLSTFPGSAETVDGLTLNLTSGSINGGDSYLIQPTRAAAQQFGVMLTDSARIAAAGPIRIEANLGNRGTGQVSAAAVTSTTGLPLPPNGDVTLTYDAAARQFNVSGGPGGTLDFDPASESNGKEFSLPSVGGLNFTVSGVPADGDTFMLQNNTGGVGDNRNALSLAGLQTKPVFQDGTTTYQEQYGRLVADVGARTRQAEANQDTQKILLDQAVAAREGGSGVNLEEEAANLIRFQQAFQAAARVISTADTMFQTLLGAVGR